MSWQWGRGGCLGETCSHQAIPYDFCTGLAAVTTASFNANAILLFHFVSFITRIHLKAGTIMSVFHDCVPRAHNRCSVISVECD